MITERHACTESEMPDARSLAHINVSCGCTMIGLCHHHWILQTARRRFPEWNSHAVTGGAWLSGTCGTGTRPLSASIAIAWSQPAYKLILREARWHVLLEGCKNWRQTAIQVEGCEQVSSAGDSHVASYAVGCQHSAGNVPSLVKPQQAGRTVVNARQGRLWHALASSSRHLHAADN